MRLASTLFFGLFLLFAHTATGAGNIDVAFNEMFDSVAGIEIEDSRHALVVAPAVFA